MKFISRITVLAFCFLLMVLAGCRKDFNSLGSVQMNFQLRFPDSFLPEFAPENITVTIKNNITGEIKYVTSDLTGAINVDLIPGTYSLTASKSYTEEETLAMTGVEQESFVNASLSPVVVSTSSTVEMNLKASTAGGLVIREYYYAGVPSFYFYDAFIEIYNNTIGEIRVDSLYIGATRTAATSNTGTTSKYGFITEGRDSVYLAQVFMIPNTGTPRYLQPGESIVVAIDGINHKDDPKGNANSPVNLGAGVADYETYWHFSSSDADAADVPNMHIAYVNSTLGLDWLVGSFGTGMVIFKTPDFDGLPVAKEPGSTRADQYKAIPIADIIDGVDVVANSAILAANKRLPLMVDAGMTTVGATYNGKSVRRKVKSVVNGRTIFMDTNNSSNDFEINNTPSPRKWN